MGNIKVDIDEPKNITTYTVTGKVSVEEIISALEMFYSNPSTLHVLWDFSEAESPNLTKEGLMKIITAVKNVMKAVKKGKRAIVVSGDFGFGMGRMYEIFTEIYDHPLAHKIFRSKNEAMKWLTGDS